MHRLRPAFKALFSQLCAWVLTLALLYAFKPALPLSLSASLLQPPLAVLIGWRLGSARWWFVIHALFTPLLMVALAADIAPAWYFAAWLVLMLFYRNTLRHQVPLYLSSQAAVEALQAALPDRPLAIVDIGSGSATMVAALARARPQDRITGVENALALFWLGRMRTRSLANACCLRADFLQLDWSQFDVVYAFLSPAPMSAIWQKAQRELKPQAWLVSNTFVVEGAEPFKSISLGEEKRLQNALHFYQPAAGKQPKQ